MSRFITRWRARKRLLEIEDSELDSTAVQISTTVAHKLGFTYVEFVWVCCNETKRPFTLLISGGAEDMSIGMSTTAQGNLNAQTGDQVYLYKAKLLIIQSITLYPLHETAGLVGQLLSEYIHPYLRDRIHPVHIDDFIDIGPASFCVVETAQQKFGLITPATQVTVAKRFGLLSPNYKLVDDALECTLELQRNVDYISPTWCAESLADFARGLQRLVDLLQAPPLYEKAVKE